MNNKIKVLMVLLLCALPCFEGFAQEQEEPDIYEIIEKETNRLQSMLNLEDWQVFYVDSTLMHNIPAMQQEIMKLQKARVENISIYQSIQDKWTEATDRSYEKFFNSDQWKKYLKSGGERAQKQRDKRKGINTKPSKKDKRKK